MSGVLKTSDFLHILPILVVAGWGCITLLADSLGRSKSPKMWPLSAMGLIIALGITCAYWWIYKQPVTNVFGGMLMVDRFALFLDAMFIMAGLLTVLLSGPYFREHRMGYGEFSVLVQLVIAGMMMLVHAADFVMLLIGLETMSLGVYAMVASWRGGARSAEAGFKYFIMGAVGSAFLIYGMALIYGKTGSTSLVAISAMVSQNAGDLMPIKGSPMFILGMFMMLGAMGFKVALVPFHAWTPDAYEGAPTTVTGFMAAAVKAAGFGALLRVFMLLFGDATFIYGPTGWGNIMWVLAIATMTLGNVAALMQTNIKRMLAYSSISHAGYLLLGVIAMGVLPKATSGPVLFYLLSYTFTTLGAFGMIAWIGGRDKERVNLEDWHGLAARHPMAALAMTLFLLSLAGMPPTAGFFGKFYIFKQALQHDSLLVLVIIGALNSVISIYYYLKPVVAMYFHEEDSAPTPIRSGALVVALVVAAVFVLAMGLMPNQYLVWAEASPMAIVGR